MEVRDYLFTKLDALRTARRELHKIPEEGYSEHKTQAYIMDYLAKLGPDSLEKLAGTGVKCVFKAKEPVRATAFRTDIDALPVTEATGLPFASTHQGKMHACGHDAHIASALMLATIVSENRDKLNEDVVILFQPAEEGGCGAVRMIEGGALVNPRPDRIFGFHVYPGMPVGKIGVRAGVVMSRAWGFNINVYGKSAHGAKPHLGNDAIVAAAELITMIESIIARNVNPADSAVFTIGRIAGGVKRNIIADSVTLYCTVRTLNDAAHERIVSRLDSILRGTETAFDVTITTETVQDYLAVDNDAGLTELYSAAVGDAATGIEQQSIGEDFSYYQREVPGFFAFAGVGEDVSPLHSPTMFFDEEALLYPLEAYMRLLGL